ncbi:hypothetical protein [Aquiflexum gelatinilyticum]|uniref:Uncharacterized protein n=1 Tax=Aquiflexum gelatinilyticum TaxID=2961943 RepID=A0A9X2SXY4_9BACT|nr:hypothetical protein [Aquiflexum gelatinilyticum]MCR9014552.1 hypothetical protein [Aquiflexum gelatinilyticum]MCS4435541.1 hypothetical protein [Aquiflexum gelatinilyticum]
MKNSLIAVLVSVTLLGCVAENNNGNDSETVYFPVKDYIEVTALNLEGAGIIKELNLNGEKETIRDTLTAEKWLEELDFFIKADISRPSLAGSYETQRSPEFLIHSLKEGEKGEVQKIVVKYEDEVIKEVSFSIKNSNLFYTSETRGVIFNQSLTGKLDHFVVETMQKVIFLKPNKMIINASVVW